VSGVNEAERLDRDRIRKLFDLRSNYNVRMGGDFQAEAWPNYDTYQSRTDRVIPVVVLSPA
jgi:hypothetical protein